MRVVWGTAARGAARHHRAGDGCARALRTRHVASRGVALMYEHCPRCRLAIRCRAHYLALERCPRCLARTGLAVALVTSPLNGAQLRASAGGGAPIIDPAAPIDVSTALPGVLSSGKRDVSAGAGASEPHPTSRRSCSCSSHSLSLQATERLATLRPRSRPGAGVRCGRVGASGCGEAGTVEVPAGPTSNSNPPTRAGYPFAHR